jgi:hypothetical protein
MLTSLEVPTKEIHERFFKAIEILKSEKTIPGIIYFIETHKFNKTRIFNVQNEVGKYTIPKEAYYILSIQYGFSMDWLMLGIGNERKKYKLPHNAEIQH